MGHEGKVHGLSITSQLLDLLAYSYAVKRDRINELFLEGVNDDDERRRIRFRIRYVLEVLSKKGLIHVVPRLLVVNVPLLLFYYKVSEESVGKSATALTSGHVGLKYSKAVELVGEVVSKYSSKFDDFVSQLLYFRKLNDVFMNTVAEEVVREVPKKIVVHREEKTHAIVLDDTDRNIEAVRKLTQLLENTFYHYLLYIIVNDEEKQEEFLNEVRHIFKSYSTHLAGELEDKWRYIRYSINNRLADDRDPRIRSIARNFLERVVYVCLAL